MKPSPQALQFTRYLAVGVLNTAVTIAVIFVCKSLIGINPWVSNALGYVAGVINSFLWNRAWVFRSHGRMLSEAARFICGFGLCYALQLGCTWALTELTPLRELLWHTPLLTISGYGVATLIGMGVYTVANFIYNRLVAFR